MISDGKIAIQCSRFPGASGSTLRWRRAAENRSIPSVTSRATPFISTLHPTLLTASQESTSKLTRTPGERWSLVNVPFEIRPSVPRLRN